GPNALYFCLFERRLIHQGKTRLDDVFDVVRAQPKLALCFVELPHQFFELFTKVSLKGKHSTYRFGFAFGFLRLEILSTAEHGFFNLRGDHWTHFAKVCADGFDLDDGSHEEL